VPDALVVGSGSNRLAATVTLIEAAPPSRDRRRRSGLAIQADV
jgi:hypothetical protein